MPIPRSGTKISSLIGFAATECAFVVVGTFWIHVSVVASITPFHFHVGLSSRNLPQRFLKTGADRVLALMLRSCLLTQYQNQLVREPGGD